MRWCCAVALAIAIAMLLARPVSADPFTEPSGMAGINPVSFNPGNLGFGDGAVPLASASGGMLADFAEPAKLGVLTLEDSDPAARLHEGFPTGDAPDGEVADAILNGVPAVLGPGVWAEPASVVTHALVDIDGVLPESAEPIERPTVAPPEPSRLLLLGAGLLGLALFLFRRARASEVAIRKSNSLSSALR